MKYIIIGNSAAGIGAVDGIRQTDKTGEITIISNEPYHTYSRPLISYLLLGKATTESMKYRPDSYYEDNNCALLHADVTKIDAKSKKVFFKLPGQNESPSQKPETLTLNSLSYDKLLVAAGSSPFVPPLEGLDTVKEKFTFMNLDDALALNNILSKDKKVLIIGAGLIGLKCAEGIIDKAGHITVLDLAPGILSSILDDEGAGIIQKHLENKGLEFILSDSVKSFCSKKPPQEGYLALTGSGREICFDILVLAVGVRPNTELMSGIAEIDRGIVIDNKSQTTATDIYAAGDCTQTLDISSGHSKIMALLPNAYMQGECAGINMAGGEKSFDTAIPMNAVGFCGLHIITAGSYTGDEYIEADRDNYQYKRLFYSDNKLNGYIMIGNVNKAGIYTSLIREQTPLDTIDFSLICKQPGLMAFSKNDRQVKLGS